MLDAAGLRLVPVRRRDAVARRTRRRCRRRRTARPRSRSSRAGCRPRRRRTCPGTICFSVPRTMWQMEVPMIMTILPGSVDRAGRDRDVRVDVRDGDGGAGLQAGRRGHLGGQPAGLLAERVDVGRELLGDDVPQAGVQRREVVRRRVADALLPDRLVAGGAGVALLLAGELQDDPVGRLDEAVGGGVDLGRLVQDLQDLGEEPLGGDLAAVALRGTTRRARGRSALTRSASGWAAWCFQSLTQACGLLAKRSEKQSGWPFASIGQHRAGGEVDADADDVGRVDAGLLQHGRDRRRQDAEVVGRVLQRPLGGRRVLPSGRTSSMTPCEYG